MNEIINKMSVYDVNDGFLIAVNGEVIFGSSGGIKESQEVIKELMKRHNIDNYSKIDAPTGFNGFQMWEEDIEELNKIIYFENSSVPSYMNTLSKIDDCDVVIIDGTLMYNNNQYDFDDFSKSWDLDEEVFMMSVIDDHALNSEPQEVSLSARDILEGNLKDVQFFNLKEIKVNNIFEVSPQTEMKSF